MLKGLGSKACYVVNDGSKVGRPIETNVGETGGVGLGDTFHTFGREAEKSSQVFLQTAFLQSPLNELL